MTTTAIDKTTGELMPVTTVPYDDKDIAVMRMENDTIMSAAQARPRDLVAVVDEIKSQLRAFRSFSQGAMYSVPVGGGKYARGLSIRMAESIAEAYGFNRVRSEVTPIDADHAKVEASFTDFQRCRVWSKSEVVPKNYTDKGGRTIRHKDDRFWKVVCAGQASRCIRDVILRSVPAGIRSELELVVNEQLDRYLDDSTVDKIIAQFSTKEITVEQLEARIGRRRQDWTKEDRSDLLGMWNALDQETATKSDLFGDVTAKDSPNEDKGLKGSMKLVEDLKGK